MWEPRPLTLLWPFMACYRGSFTFTISATVYLFTAWPRNVCSQSLHSNGWLHCGNNIHPVVGWQWTFASTSIFRLLGGTSQYDGNQNRHTGDFVEYKGLFFREAEYLMYDVYSQMLQVDNVHTNITEDYLPVRDAVYSGRSSLNFRRNVPLPSSG
jgi:hypothetical protein